MAAQSTTPRILVVDDDEDTVSSLVDVLRQAVPDARIRSASTAEEAIRMIEATSDRERYDLIVTDLVLPGLDGVRVIEAARKLNPTVHRVLMTAALDLGAVEGQLSKRYDSLLSKPVEPAALEAMVARSIRAQQTDQAARDVVSPDN